jgi:RNA polymerase sigma-70 factor (ECF subfamily)
MPCVSNQGTSDVASSDPAVREARERFGAIADRYSPQLYRMAFYRLGNREDAEDAVQDALGSAFRHFSQFEGRSQLSTWLGSILINSTRMQLRKRSGRTFQSLDEIPPRGQPIPADLLLDDGPSPFELYQRQEYRGLLRQMLDRLPPRLRSAIQLRKIIGLSEKEAAQALKVKIGSVKCQLHRAYAKLSLSLLSEKAEAFQFHRKHLGSTTFRKSLSRTSGVRVGCAPTMPGCRPGGKLGRTSMSELPLSG